METQPPARSPRASARGFSSSSPMFPVSARRMAGSSSGSTPTARASSSMTGRSRAECCPRSRPVSWPPPRAAARRSWRPRASMPSSACSVANRWAPSSRPRRERSSCSQAPPPAGAAARGPAPASRDAERPGARAAGRRFRGDPGHGLPRHRRARIGEGGSRRYPRVRPAERGDAGWRHGKAAPVLRGLSGRGRDRSEPRHLALAPGHRERTRRRPRCVTPGRGRRYPRGRRHGLRRGVDRTARAIAAGPADPIRDRAQGGQVTRYDGETCVLAYSGGLDTSVAVAWLRETLGFEVVTCTGDLGATGDLEAVQRKAIASGARKAIVQDARDIFLRYFVWPALQAGALYEDRYPLATALGRPLLAKLLGDAPRAENARFVAHGCTGKGNDQVRFDLAVGALAPDLTVIAPMRGGMNMTRDEEIDYARKHGIPVEATKKSPYSVDMNLWGRSIEAGVLEDPWGAPPRDVFQWTVDADEAPAKPREIEIGFDEGVPVTLDGAKVESIDLVQRLNDLAGKHGVGRIDMVEDRLVGIKSREIYEAPAAVLLHQAHRALESLVLTKESLRFKTQVGREYAELVYNGLWFSAHHQDLAAYVRSTQRFVTGEVRVRLDHGTATVVGRRSPHSLYSTSLATYGKGDAFDQRASEGFIKVFGLPLRTQARTQALWGEGSEASLDIPKKALSAPTTAKPSTKATANKKRAR